ncbi:MAG: hypothetical protein ABSB75_07175 [Candidatus Limnocylindrales bacterium]
MNEQLPPVDSNIRAQLERRSGGRLPDDLGARVSKALDRAGERGAGTRWPPLAWSAPRLAGAGIGVAFVAIVVIAIGLPVLRGGPASATGYPAERPLTAAELAGLMAGPVLATNTPLVARVTIDANTDVCPMDRYPTIGVIEGMGSQVCVMGSAVSSYMTVTEVTGVFAFRYIGPGVLGLLGQITPASDSRLAFGPADTWPQDKTFLVEGWLGSTPYPTSVGSVGIACDQPLYGPGDPLNPEGVDNLCAITWLTSGHNTVATLDISNGQWIESAQGGHVVGAGGARYYDSISTAPVHGVYVVRSAVGPCPGASPQSSIGCDGWKVLAKVDGFPLPAPSASAPTATASTSPGAPATPVATPSAPGLAPAGLLGPGNRPLTQGEFASLWAADPAHLAGRIVVAKGPVPTGFECWSARAADASASPGTCQVAILDGLIAQEGYWAVRVGADGKLAIVGEIAMPQSGYVFTNDLLTATETLKGQVILVDGWLSEVRYSCDHPETPCPSNPEFSLLIGSTDASTRITLQTGAYKAITGNDPNVAVSGPPVHGLYLVRVDSPQHATVLAAMEQLPVPQ